MEYQIKYPQDVSVDNSVGNINWVNINNIKQQDSNLTSVKFVATGVERLTNTSLTSWTCPEGVYYIKVECYGPGGNAHSENYNSPGAQGGGYGCKNDFITVPGQSYSIGIGVNAGSSYKYYSPGTPTFFKDLSGNIIAQGDWGGQDTDKSRIQTNIGDVTHKGGNGVLGNYILGSSGAYYTGAGGGAGGPNSDGQSGIINSNGTTTGGAGGGGEAGNGGNPDQSGASYGGGAGGNSGGFRSTCGGPALLKITYLNTPTDTYYLKAQNFGFNIPDNATVTGIEVTIKRTVNNSNAIKDKVISLIKSNGVYDTVNKSNGDYWISGETKTFGGQNDLWNGTWTPSDINSTNFGVYIQATAVNDVEAGIDSITITVYYYTNVIESQTISIASNIRPYGEQTSISTIPLTTELETNKWSQENKQTTTWIKEPTHNDLYYE